MVLLDIPSAHIIYSINSVRFRTSYVWNSLPAKIKSSKKLKVLTDEIKSWEGKKCTCKISKVWQPLL